MFNQATQVQTRLQGTEKYNQIYLNKIDNIRIFWIRTYPFEYIFLFPLWQFDFYRKSTNGKNAAIAFGIRSHVHHYK